MLYEKGTQRKRGRKELYERYGFAKMEDEMELVW